MSFVRSLLLFNLLLAGCTSGDVNETGVETDLPPDTPKPADQVTDWCEAAAGGAPGTRAFAQDFARVHVGQRLFGPSDSWNDADTQLTFLMASEEPIGTGLVAPYASLFEHICAVSAETVEEQELRVEVNDNVAIVYPGTGTLSLPDEVTRVVVTLLEPHRADSVRDVMASLLTDNITLATRTQRQMIGFPAQEDGWTHYETTMKTGDITLTGTASIERELIFWTGQRLSPDVAMMVGGLRLQEQASIVGYNVHAAVAESTWSGLETEGLVWRQSSLSTGQDRWPDVIPADISTRTHAYYTHEPVERLALDNIANRDELKRYDRVDGQPSVETSQAALEAALLVAYGTLDWFYPYFEIVGRDLDAALLTELETVGAMTSVARVDMRHSVGRLMHSIYDGHGYVYDWGTTDWPDGYLAIQLQQIDEEPVVRVSKHEGVNAGDTIVAIDGVPAADWYAEAESHFSAASDGYLFVMASDELKEVYGTKTLRLRAPNGTERNETLSPKSWSALEDVPWGGTLRDNGWLTDLEAPNLYYVNLSGQVTPDEAVITNQWTSVSEADGIVLDMRDYPNLDIYGFAGYFNSSTYTAPWFEFPTWTGPTSFEWTQEIWSFSAASNPYTGPIVLLTGNYAVSAAECFSQMLVGLDNVTVIGQQSASTNGTVTNVWLPGQIQIYFTGMRLLNLDGSNFHGEGIQPDIEITPTVHDLAAEIDPELNAAIDQLSL